MSLTRRQVFATSLGAIAVSSSIAKTASAAPVQEQDPDLSSIENRLLSLSNRGGSLSTERKYLVLLATAAAQGIASEAARCAADALKAGVQPVFIKEALYQCSPYVGIGRVLSIMPAVNDEMAKAGVKLPLPSQATVTDDNRLAKGIEVQTAIFGDRITKMHADTPDNQKALIIGDLSGYCFGDFYTRTGLSIKDRELAVFAAIAAIGGCESQLKSHIAANLKEGNTKQDLIDALQIAVPLNGFPRTLNALGLVNAA